MTKQSTKCKDCNRYAMKNSDYCWYCDPEIDESEKKAARSSGGKNGRIIPHGLNPADFLPIETVADQKRLLNAMVASGMMNIVDIERMLRTTLPLIKEFSNIFELELVESLSHRINLLESKVIEGRQIDNHNGDIKLLEEVNENETEDQRINAENIEAGEFAESSRHAGI